MPALVSAASAHRLQRHAVRGPCASGRRPPQRARGKARRLAVRGRLSRASIGRATARHCRLETGMQSAWGVVEPPGGMPHKGVTGARSSTGFAGSPWSALAPALREVGAIRLFHRGSVPACPVHVRKMLPSVKPPHEDERDPAPFLPFGFGPRPVLVRAGLSGADAPSLFLEDVNPPRHRKPHDRSGNFTIWALTKLERDAAARARNIRKTNASACRARAPQCNAIQRHSNTI